MIGRRVTAAIVLAATVVAGIALIEGLASLAITAGLFFGSSGRLAQERYAHYDPDLGWASLPNVAIPDMYGPGADLHTTAQGFRGRVEPAPTPPPGKIRVVCSGDSFTFGYGVGDDLGWCALLATLEPRLETINMGQGGYGVDQSFLWYRRDGVRLRPAIHLFAFIDGDFERMRSARFLDYGKPTLALRDGRLAVENVPAWRRPFWVPTVRVREIAKRTKLYELVDRLRRRSGPAPTAKSAVTPTERAAVADVALALFTELRTSAEKDGGTLVLVYLPTIADCHLPIGAPNGLDWWPVVEQKIRPAAFRVLDLSDDCRRLPANEQDAMFFPEGAVQYYGAAGHYTPNGNRVIANTMMVRLRDVIEDALGKAP